LLQSLYFVHDAGAFADGFLLGKMLADYAGPKEAD
jgi:hypothetical protein